MIAPVSSSQARAMMRGANSITVTSMPSSAADAAASSPIRPAPITTRCLHEARPSLMARAWALGAQVMHARHAGRQQRQLAHQRAGGDHQRVVGQRAAGGDDLARGAVDRGAAGVELDRDAVGGEPARAGDRRVFGLGLAEQHGLRQRRLLVGLAGLVGDERDVRCRRPSSWPRWRRTPPPARRR